MRIFVISWVHFLATLCFMVGASIVALNVLEVNPQQARGVGWALLLCGGIVSLVIRNWISPRSSKGFPVEPNWDWVNEETQLEVGSHVLAQWQGLWWRAIVVAVRAEERVTIHYLGWNKIWNETVDRSRLQLDHSSELACDKQEIE